MSPFRPHAIYATRHGFDFLIGHVVAADSGIVPIGDADRTVGSDANIGRPEPGILSRQDVFDTRLITGALRLRSIGADKTRARVTMDKLVAKNRGKNIAFVDQDTSGRTRPSVEQVGN